MVKNFYTNDCTLTPLYLLCRDCNDRTNKDFLIIGDSDVIYLEYVDGNTTRRESIIGKVATIDFDKDIIRIKRIVSIMGEYMEQIIEVYCPNIIGASRSLPYYVPLEKITNRML